MEWGGLPGLVSVIFETMVTLKREIEWIPGGFKITMKVESLWLQKRSTGPVILPCQEIQNGLGNRKYCGRTENFLHNGHFTNFS